MGSVWNVFLMTVFQRGINILNSFSRVKNDNPLKPNAKTFDRSSGFSAFSGNNPFNLYPMKNLLTVLKLEWLSQIRSSMWHKKLLVNLFLWFMVIYLAGTVLLLGFVLDDFLLKVFKRESPLEVLNGWLLYYFFFDFILRYFVQKLPAMVVEPYLHLPISKKSLANLILIKSGLSVFNIMHLLIFIPFAIEVPFTYYTAGEAWGWTAGVISFMLMMNYVLMYVKRSAEISAWVYIGLIAVLAGLFGLEYFEILAFSDYSAIFFNSFFQMPIIGWCIPILLIAAYGINFRYIVNHLYMGDLTSGDNNKVSFIGSGFFSRFGLMGQLIDMDLKFIWRNKRTRSVLLLTVLFLFYGLLVFPQDVYEDNYLMYLLFSMIITGMFTLNYGQYLLGWEAGHFDHVLTRNISYKQFYQSKFLLFALISTVCMILSIPYAYFGWNILLVLFTVYLFNVGIVAPVVMFFGSFNPKKIDLSKGSMMNWQGVGAAQFLLIVPVMGIPFMIYGLGVWIWDPIKAIILVGIIGVVGILISNYSIGLLGKWMEKRRYEIASDFRNA